MYNVNFIIKLNESQMQRFTLDSIIRSNNLFRLRVRSLTKEDIQSLKKRAVSINTYKIYVYNYEQKLIKMFNRLTFYDEIFYLQYRLYNSDDLSDIINSNDYLDVYSYKLVIIILPIQNGKYHLALSKSSFKKNQSIMVGIYDSLKHSLMPTGIYIKNNKVRIDQDFLNYFNTSKNLNEVANFQAISKIINDVNSLKEIKYSRIIDIKFNVDYKQLFDGYDKLNDIVNSLKLLRNLY